MTPRRGVTSGRLRRLLREPTLHFFVLGAAIFVLHHILVGDPRVVVIRPALRADLERNIRDQQGRAATPAELDAALDTWKRNEALYREALREGLERDDATVRTVLADKLRARALQALPRREPSEAELAAWLAERREAYDTPVRYVFSRVSFPRNEEAASAQRAGYARALADGRPPASLGRSVVRDRLTAAELRERFGASAAAAIRGQAPGSWQPLDTSTAFLLVRLDRREGGLPSPEVLHDQLTVDWRAFADGQAVERAMDAIVARYRFEEKP